MMPIFDLPFGLAGSACEMCFGALVDSPVVAAVTASMFLLLVVTSVVLVGITAFFRRAHERAHAGPGTAGDEPPEPEDTRT